MKTRAATPRKPKIKAHPSVDTVSRCKIGAGILHARAQAVRIATVDTWNDAEGKGWMKYCRHVAKCEQCGAYEAQKRLQQEIRYA